MKKENEIGKLEDFNNKLCDLKEAIGNELIPVINFWLNKLQSIYEKIVNKKED
jgi:hypothetical protein